MMPDRGLPSVSVIIPVYNKRKTVLRALHSVTSQSVSDLEIIVIDDGSTDGSAELIDENTYPQLRLIRQENAGPGRARNVGAAAARAPLLAFLDADDEWKPDFLPTGMRALSENRSCVAFVSGYDSGGFRNERPNLIKLLGKTLGPQPIPIEYDGPSIKRHVDALHSSCVIVRTETFERCGGFYDKNSCRYGEDSFLWLQVLLSGPIYWCPQELVSFHVEDSALGFATTKRTCARPISTEFLKLGDSLHPQHKFAMQRAVRAYVEMDLTLLVDSGAFRQARKLRRLHGMGGLVRSVKDVARFYKSKILRRSFNSIRPR